MKPVIHKATCKVIFPFGTTQEKAQEILAKYDREAKIYNHYTDHEVGCNKFAFSVVDLSYDIMPIILKDALVTRIDQLTYSKDNGPPSESSCATGCGCAKT